VPLLRNSWGAKGKIFLLDPLEVFRHLLMDFEEPFVDFEKAFQIETVDGLHEGVKVLRLGEKDDGAHGVPPVNKK